MYFNRRAFLHNCTVTEVKKYKKYFNLQYILTSKKANMLYNLSSTEIISTDKLHSAHFISCVLKYTGKCFKWQLTHSTNNLYENAEISVLTVIHSQWQVMKMH